ncbi:MAG: molybdopterin-dependent oxidoreductase [Rhizobiales bacterium]|nr:molybdopterin-dependent oxidoreductase [Hyphomicrobiales bacterium]
MAFDLKKPTRRQLLIAGGVAGGGLVLGYAVMGSNKQEKVRAALVNGEGEMMLGTWLKISPDNVITVYVPHSEMGQGVHTSLPMMAAEEMNADWSLVRMEQAPAQQVFKNDALATGFLGNEMGFPKVFPGFIEFAGSTAADFMHLQVTGGSSSVRYTGQLGMRVAGAAALDMLRRAAAKSWNVPLSEVVADKNILTHAASGKSATYGEMASAAAEISPPSDPVLKAKADYTIVGQPIPRFDIPSKVNGTAQYGIDARLPGMLYAAIAPCPVFGGDVASFDGSAALNRRGVKKVIQIPGAVAVVADSYWRAKEALSDVKIAYDLKGNEAVSSDTIYAQYDKALAEDNGSADVEKGDAAAALQGAERFFEADYKVPYLAHACMEPMNCTVHIKDGKAEVWVGAQDALGAAAFVAKTAGLSLDDVTLHPLMLGGGFGRRGSTIDFIEQATQIAMQVDAPVKLVWSRENDVQHDCYRPAITSKFQAALDADGNPVAWHNRYIGKNEPADAAHIPYAVENQSIRYVESETHVPFGAWRSVAHSQHTFFTESFIDELAHAAGKDPFVYRRDLLKDQPRHLAVLELAAEKGNWGGPLEKGRARGIAIQQSFQSIVAEVAEISLGDDGRVKVHKVVAAVDCGEVINPDTAVAQVESGIVYGLTAALYGDITIEQGAVVQSNFPDYQMVTLADMPVIETHLIESGAAIGGLGEPATPPIAAAVSNAVFALTGKRIRKLPLMNHDLTTAGKFAQAAD